MNRSQHAMFVCHWDKNLQNVSNFDIFGQFSDRCYIKVTLLSYQLATLTHIMVSNDYFSRRNIRSMGTKGVSWK